MSDYVEAEFRRHAELWHEETAYVSSLSVMFMNSHYQRIIGLGPLVVPLLIEDLREKLATPELLDHWFWALTAIMGDDKAAGTTTLQAAAEAWVAWFDALSPAWLEVYVNFETKGQDDGKGASG